MGIQQKNPIEAKKILDGELDSVYLDVRSPEEFERGHAEGAMNIPIFFHESGKMVRNDDFGAVVRAIFPEKCTPLVVACQAGKRSQIACEELDRLGYECLYNVTDGFGGWMRAALPIENENDEADSYAELFDKAKSLL